MQSALAILPFPLSTVETSIPGAEPTDKDFSAAFGERFLATEGDTAPSDSMFAGPAQAPLWLGPVLSSPTVVHGRTDEGDGASCTSAESIESFGKDLTAPHLSPVAAALGVRDLGVDVVPALPTAPMIAGSDQGASPNHPRGTNTDPTGMPADPVLQFDSREAVPEKVSAGSWPIETQAWRLPLQHTNALSADASVDAEPGSAKIASDTTEAVSDPAKIVVGNPAEMTTPIDPLESDSPDLIGRPIEGRTERREPSSASSEPNARAIERTGLTKQTEIDADVSSSPDAPKAARGSIVDKDLESLSAHAVVQPREPLGSQTRPASSFWERFFAGMTAPGSVAGLQPDQCAAPGLVVIPSPTMAATTGAILPVETPASAIGLPTTDSQPERSETAVVDEIPAKGISSVVTVDPRPLPEKQTESMPLILLSAWDEGLVDSRNQIDPVLSSFPPLQSGSGTGAASGPQGFLSLPVQQVATQLVGILVGSFDNATELALAPEELGRVRLRLEPDAANPDRMMILIDVERPETLDLFRRHAGELAEAIKAAGYSGADIGFGQHGQGRSPDRQHGEASLGSGQPPEDQTPVSPARRNVVGANLDLRL